MHEEIQPVEERTAARGEIDRGELAELHRKARAAGFVNYNMPVEVGGQDWPMLAQVAIEEVAGHATNGLGFIVAGRGPRELLDIATPEQVERYVLPVVRGETYEAWAITEPEAAGSDVNAIQATAVRDGDAWRLNGEKWYVTGGDRAGFFLVLAWAEGEQTLFIVERDTPGLELVRAPRFLHDPYISRHVELVLADCRVPDSNRVPAGGSEGSRRWFLVERLMIAARCCGSADRLLDLATAWSQQRVAFGSPIAEHQAVQFMLADSLTELLAARLLTYHVASELEASPDPKIVHGKVAMAKLYASEMANRVADRVLQIFGGRGYMEENPASRYFRELRVDRIWEGTSEIQRLIIARGLLKRGLEPYAG